MRKTNIFTILTVALSGFNSGYGSAIIAGVLLFITPLFALSAWQEGVAVSTMLFGAFLGTLLAGYIAGRWGRKKGMMLAAFFTAAGAVLSAGSKDINGFLIGRFIQGAAIGSFYVFAPLYLSEMAPPEKRGKYVTANQLAITIGILAAYGASFFLSSSGNWQAMLWIGGSAGLLQFFCLFFIPESPQVAGDKNPPWSACFKTTFSKVLFIGIGLSIFQQVTGINAVIYYAPRIFEEAGYATLFEKTLATLGIGLINVLSTLVSLPLLDRWGRRPLLFLSLVGMTLALCIISLAFYTQTAWIDKLAAGGLVLYIISFAVGLGPVTWLILSEIYPRSIRSRAMSLATLTNCLANYLVALVFLDMTKALTSAGAFACFAFLALVALFFVWKWIPETKGKSLKEIEDSVLR